MFTVVPMDTRATLSAITLDIFMSVELVAAPTPLYLGSTEFMMEAMLGEPNSPPPTPTSARTSETSSEPAIDSYLPMREMAFPFRLVIQKPSKQPEFKFG